MLDWCYGFYNHVWRHSTIVMVSPINCENAAATNPGSRIEETSTIWREPHDDALNVVLVNARHTRNVPGHGYNVTLEPLNDVA